MRRSNRPRIAAALAVAIGVGACGSDSTGPTGSLDPAVSMEIASELMFSVLGMGFIGSSAVAADVAQGFSSAAETISETVPCDAGGNVTVAGTFTHTLSQEGTGAFAYDLRQTPNNCGIQTSQGVFQVNGNPHLQLTANVNVADFQLVGTSNFSFTGGFTFIGAGGSGNCIVNMAWSINWANPEQTTVTGSMCGHPLG
jgi:hypothetical protein